MEGIANPTSDKDRALKVRVSSLSKVPYAKGKYDCELTVKGKTEGLLPSMTCSVVFTLAEESDDKAKAKKDD